VQTSRQRYSSAAGFSLIELMLVVGLVGIVSGIAVIQIDAIRPGLQGDGAMRVVMGQLNMARETAVTQREEITVEFVGERGLRVTNDGVSSELYFESGVEYELIPGTGDTRDEFGVDGPTTFGGEPTTTVRFNPEGELIDANGSPMNGTVFLAIPGSPMSARAVTVLGSTGRVRGYRWNGKVWTQV
jgi:prepilin-type N-terminal cleavage/methylation domain-containing protein